MDSPTAALENTSNIQSCVSTDCTPSTLCADGSLSPGDAELELDGIPLYMEQTSHSICATDGLGGSEKPSQTYLRRFLAAVSQRGAELAAFARSLTSPGRQEDSVGADEPQRSRRRSSDFFTADLDKQSKASAAEILHAHHSAASSIESTSKCAQFETSEGVLSPALPEGSGKRSALSHTTAEAPPKFPDATSQAAPDSKADCSHSGSKGQTRNSKEVLAASIRNLQAVRVESKSALKCPDWQAKALAAISQPCTVKPLGSMTLAKVKRRSQSSSPVKGSRAPSERKPAALHKAAAVIREGLAKSAVLLVDVANAGRSNICNSGAQNTVGAGALASNRDSNSDQLRNHPKKSATVVACNQQTQEVDGDCSTFKQQQCTLQQCPGSLADTSCTPSPELETRSGGIEETVAAALQNAEVAAEALRRLQQQQHEREPHERAVAALRKRLQEAATHGTLEAFQEARSTLLQAEKQCNIADEDAKMRHRQHASAKHLAVELRASAGTRRGTLSSAEQSIWQLMTISSGMETAPDFCQEPAAALLRQVFASKQIADGLAGALGEAAQLGMWRSVQTALKALAHLASTIQARGQQTLCSIACSKEDNNPSISSWQLATAQHSNSLLSKQFTPGGSLGSQEASYNSCSQAGNISPTSADAVQGCLPAWPQVSAAPDFSRLRKAFLDANSRPSQQQPFKFLPHKEASSQPTLSSDPFGRHSLLGESQTNSPSDREAPPAGRMLTEEIVREYASPLGLEETSQLDLNLEMLSGLGRGLLACSKLQSLSLSNNRLTDVSGLDFCCQLVCLDLSANFLTSTAALSSLAQLKVLDVHHNRLATLRGMEACLQLKKVQVSSNQLTSLGCNLPATLEDLDVASNQLSSLHGLEGCSRIQQLTVTGNALRSLEPIAACRMLRRLDAGHNQLSSFPTCLPTALLCHLSLQANQLTSLQGLPWMPHLQALYLQDNDISCVARIHGAPLLAILNLAFNKVASLDTLYALSSLPSLQRLDLNGCPVEQYAGYLQLRHTILPCLTQDANRSPVSTDTITDQLRAAMRRFAALPVQRKLPHLFLGCSQLAGLHARPSPCLGVVHEEMAATWEQVTFEQVVRQQILELEAWQAEAKDRALTATRGPVQRPLNLLLVSHLQQLTQDPASKFQEVLVGGEAWLQAQQARMERLAVRIQAAWRGHLARSLAAGMRCQASRQKQAAAATAIQAKVRGALVRRRLSRARCAYHLSLSAAEDEELNQELSKALALADTVLEQASQQPSLCLMSVTANDSSGSEVQHSIHKQAARRQALLGSQVAVREAQPPSRNPDEEQHALEDAEAGHVCSLEWLAAVQPGPELQVAAPVDAGWISSSQGVFTSQGMASFQDFPAMVEAPTQEPSPSTSRDPSHKQKAAVMADWGFQNEATAAALLRRRQRQQSLRAAQAKKQSLQDPAVRLARFRAASRSQP